MSWCLDASTNTEGALYETNVSKSTVLFLSSSIPPLKTLAEEVNPDKLNQLIQLQKEGDNLADEINKITQLTSNFIGFLDEVKIRVDMESEVLDSHCETVNHLATKTDLENIRSTQIEGFSVLKMKEEVISETQAFLIEKLGEINSLIQRQILDQEKLERTRTNSEVSFRQKLDSITSTLQSDIANIKSAIKEIETGEMGSKRRLELDAENIKELPSKNRNE